MGRVLSQGEINEDRTTHASCQITSDSSTAGSSDKSEVICKKHLDFGTPTWAACHSTVYDPLPVVRVSTLPLLPAPANEWSTLITVLKQAQGINAIVLGFTKNSHYIGFGTLQAGQAAANV